MKDVKGRILDLQNNCYVAVLDHHWKYLKYVTDRHFKNNSVIVGTVNIMTRNTKHISMPHDQWMSYVGNIFNVDEEGTLSHDKLLDHVSMGSFIHHKSNARIKKARRKVVTPIIEKVSKLDDVRSSNQSLQIQYSKKINAAVGASDGIFVFHIVKFFCLINLYTTVYLNTQTGTTEENKATFDYITQTATKSFIELANAVNEGKMPDLISENTLGVLGEKLWWGLIDGIFRTPFYYARGMGMQLWNWQIDTYETISMIEIINMENRPSEFKDYETEFNALKGIPTNEILKLVNPDYLDDKYGDDVDTIEKMYMSALRVFEKFNLDEKFTTLGKYGTDQQYEGELANGRTIKSLFSYAKIYNEFDGEDFFNNIVVTVGNAFTGNVDQDINLRKKTIVTMGLISSIVIFPGALYLANNVKNLWKGRDKILEEKKAAKELEEDSYLYEHKRKYGGWKEGILDAYEFSMYTFLVYTAMIEFVGISNVVGNDGTDALDTFISSSYSSEWYYITSLAGIKMFQTSRKANNLGYRNPDNVIRNQWMPYITGKALEFVLIMASEKNINEFLHNSYGMGTFAPIVMLFSVLMNSQSASKIDDKLIETHSNLVKNAPDRPYAKILRSKLSHNKKFMRAAVSHISII